MDTWEMIRDERVLVGKAFGELPSAAWDAPSLCARWKNVDVLAHMIEATHTTPPLFFARFVRSGFNFDKMVNSNIERVKSWRTPQQLISEYQSRADSRSAPPGPTMSWLGETIVHGEDILTSQGVSIGHPIEHLVAVADFYKNSNLLIGSKKRIAGLRLEATDADWQTGDGPTMSGPILALVQAMTGRTSALDKLSGEGVALLRSR